MIPLFFFYFRVSFWYDQRRPGRLIVDFSERLNSLSFSNLYITRNYRRFPFLAKSVRSLWEIDMLE